MSVKVGAATRDPQEGKIYVLRNRSGMYWTDRKGKARGSYWGLYVGEPGGKRYSAARFDGGEALGRVLEKNPGIEAVEVDA